MPDAIKLPTQGHKEVKKLFDEHDKLVKAEAQADLREALAPTSMDAPARSTSWSSAISTRQCTQAPWGPPTQRVRRPITTPSSSAPAK